MLTAQQSQPPSGRERRQHRRYSIHQDALAFIGTEPGSIIDMSEGGLAVHFAPMGSGVSFPRQIDLFFAQSRLYLQKLPVAVVNEITPPPRSIFSTIMPKRYCIQFGPLSNQQKTLVDRFLEHCRLQSN